MNNRSSETSDQILTNQQLTLLELLDRLLDKGVMAKGEILLSVADIDLVYLNLGLLLSSVKTVEHAAREGGGYRTFEARPPQLPPTREVSDETRLESPRDELDTLSSVAQENSTTRAGRLASRTLPPGSDTEPAQTPEPRAHVDPKNVEKGLTRLVLTLVDLIRKLMEKQAIRRIEDGQLSAQEIEKVGNAFFILDEKMEELKEVFGLKDEDLNLNLGPLGDLL